MAGHLRCEEESYGERGWDGVLVCLYIVDMEAVVTGDCNDCLLWLQRGRPWCQKIALSVLPQVTKRPSLDLASIHGHTRIYVGRGEGEPSYL